MLLLFNWTEIFSTKLFELLCSFQLFAKIFIKESSFFWGYYHEYFNVMKYHVASSSEIFFSFFIIYIIDLWTWYSFASILEYVINIYSLRHNDLLDSIYPCGWILDSLVCHQLTYTYKLIDLHSNSFFLSSLLFFFFFKANLLEDGE